MEAIRLGSRPGAPLYVCPYFCCKVTSELDEWNPSGRYLDCFGRTAADENPDRAYPEEDDAAEAGAAPLLVGAELWVAAAAAPIAGVGAGDAAAFTGVGGWGVANAGGAPDAILAGAAGGEKG
mmetsp:Transcript_28460/g.82326  ORF Transcript_28460/g.82326 Transcript_28460/m.82326 type:complete len:123 (-) Transcript_28460:108-476(-)